VLREPRRNAVTDPRNRPDDRPNSGSMPLVDQLQALQGEEMPADQDAVVDADEIESEDELTDTELYLGDLEAGAPPDRTGAGGDIQSLEGLADRDLRAGETDNPYVASDEGLTYIPPSDPPVIPSDDPQGVEVAAGTGSSSIDEPYDEDHHGEALPFESEITARVREALEADAATSALADRIRISTIDDTVVLRGTVDTLDDGDSLAEVTSRVTGVNEVRDETQVAGLD
jgi:hypothetical protein